MKSEERAFYCFGFNPVTFQGKIKGLPLATVYLTSEWYLREKVARGGAEFRILPGSSLSGFFVCVVYRGRMKNRFGA